MSLYFVPAGVTAARLQSVAKELVRRPDEAVTRTGQGGFLWVGRQPRRFGPAFDERSGVYVVCSGRLAYSSDEWMRAEELRYSGGLAARLILDRYLLGGIEAVAPYNGAAVVVIHDPRAEQTHIWTDQFGYHPCFAYRSEHADECIISTFPDAILSDPKAHLTYDLASIAEFIQGWRATPPHTYFTEAKHIGPATRMSVDIRTKQVTRRIYWTPFRDGYFPSIGAAAEELAHAVKTAIFERTAIAERPLFFVSGGSDSRVMLFCAADPTRVVGASIYEHAGTEIEIARDLCAAAGSQFIALQRDADYYPRSLADIVRWSGGMWSAEDAHYPGVERCIEDLDPDLIMTACTVDWLFKGYGLEKEYIGFLGRNLPFLKYVNNRVDGFLPNVPQPAPAALALEIKERMAAWFEGCPEQLVTAHDRLAVEDRRVRPACYTVSVSGQIMYRVFPYDTFLADSRVADCYSRIHPDWKLNREVWGKAAARLSSGAGQIVDANFGWRVDAGAFEKALVFAKGWFERRLRRMTRNSADVPSDRPPSAGSWPDYGWYATHSPTLRDLWESVSAEERERMSLVAGADPWRKPLAAYASDGNYLFRLLTMLSHWRETERRRRTAMSLAPIAVSAAEPTST